MTPILLLAIGAGGLAVATDSPDSLCPPIDEAREVIHARVGAVTGGAFEARYGMRRNTLSGESLVVLTLRNEQQDVLLEREIPVENGECSDVALALALILERYFTDLAASSSGASQPARSPDGEGKTEGARTSNSGEVPQAQESQTTPEESEARSDQGELDGDQPDAKEKPRAAASLSPWSIRALAGIGQGPTPEVGLGGAFQLKPWWMLSLDTSFQLLRTEVVSSGYRISTIRHAIYASSLMGGALFPHSWWGAGPSLGGQLQVAELLSASTRPAGAQTRVFASLGIQGLALWEVSERFWFGAMGRVSMLLGGDEFVVLNSAGEEASVLELPVPSWDASFVASFRF